jgi:2-phosphoglycerate kinase
MHNFGYGDIHKNNYRMMSSFHHQRIPIIIFIAGMPCVGKSTLATMLSERLNMPTVLKTDLLCDILRSGFNLLKGSDCGDAPLSLRRFKSKVEIADSLDKESDLIAKGLHCDFIKCITEGKAMIVEGLHVSMRMISKLKQLVAEHINSGTAEKVIVVPLIITINNARLHRELIENWYSCQPQHLRKHFEESVGNLDHLQQQFMWIQEHLIASNASYQLDCRCIEYGTETLDLMQTEALNEIQKVV